MARTPGPAQLPEGCTAKVDSSVLLHRRAAEGKAAQNDIQGLLMRINFGCGRRVLDGFCNIDATINPDAPRPPEIVHAVEFDRDGEVINPVELEDGCAEYLQAFHVIEHVYAWEAKSLVLEWMRLLKPGGKLVLELPNLECAARNLLAGMSDQMCMWPFYGDPGHKDPYMCHRWAYTPETIKALLSECGLIKIKVLPPQTHGKRANRDMRVEAFRI